MAFAFEKTSTAQLIRFVKKLERILKVKLPPTVSRCKAIAV
jgi:hypothetical protein